MEYFKDVSALIIPNKMGKSRAKLFSDKISANGGSALVLPQKSKPKDVEFTHVVIDPALSANTLEKIIRIDDMPGNCKVTSSTWLSRCIEQKKLVDVTGYLVDMPQKVPMPIEASNVSDLSGEPPPAKLRKSEDCSQSVCEDELGNKTLPLHQEQEDTTPSHSGTEQMVLVSGGGKNEVEATSSHDLPGHKKINTDKFVCFRSSADPRQEKKNPNSDTIDKLQSLVDVYKGSKEDRWRVYAYQRAIHALKASDKLINTFEAAIALPSVGKSIAEKIVEISASGALEKLDNLQSSDEVQARQLFTRIWGCGPETASQWVNQGLRTLDDVREKAKLTSNQKIGLKYFDEFDERMKREEVTSIEDKVRAAVESMSPSGLQMITCGSYRRGRPTCGDVDILITHPDGRSHVGVFDRLINILHEQGFLTDDLTFNRNMTGGMSKYLGVCLSPPPVSKHRRIDIIVTPYNQFGCALVYFTGSAHFNRSMRLLADKIGMSLTEHALYKDVIRNNREIVHHGVIVPTPTEESVFEALGIPYREPEERDHY